MWEGTAAIEIAAQPQTVWSVIADLERHPELAGSGEVLTVENISGPLAPGATWESSERVKMAGSFVARSELLEVEEPRALAWRSYPPPVVKDDPAAIADVTWRFTLEQTDSGTRLTQTFRVVEPQVGGGRFKLFYLLTRRASTIQRGMERTLRNVKDAVEEARTSAA